MNYCLSLNFFLQFFKGPFATQPPGGGMAGLLASSASKADSLRIQLSREEWFHGPISRKDAESLLKNVTIIFLYSSLLCWASPVYHLKFGYL
jgi:hypothetical protein